jgi:hypothetical protein
MVSKAKPMNGIGYNIARGGAVGNLLVMLTMIVEQSPRKKQATSNRQQCKAQSVSHPEWSSLANRYGSRSAIATSKP